MLNETIASKIKETLSQNELASLNQELKKSPSDVLRKLVPNNLTLPDKFVNEVYFLMLKAAKEHSASTIVERDFFRDLYAKEFEQLAGILGTICEKDIKNILVEIDDLKIDDEPIGNKAAIELGGFLEEYTCFTAYSRLRRDSDIDFLFF